MTMTATTTMPQESPLNADPRERARRLGFWGLLANWEAVGEAPWIETILRYEEVERARRTLERRLHRARIGRFKLMADFEWSWPKKIDRELVEDLFRFEFLEEAANVILMGPNGVGKTLVAQNLAHQAILRGHTVRFVNASALLNELAAQETGSALARTLRRYLEPRLLVIDEVGYLGSTAKHADLLFQLVSQRYQEKSSILTTNKPFSEWNQVFPNAGCIVSLVDRLLHKAEVVEIQGESYRFKEAQERQARKAKTRKGRAK
jgi:DNA replication protein DnaC